MPAYGGGGDVGQPTVPDWLEPEAPYEWFDWDAWLDTFDDDAIVELPDRRGDR